MLPFIPAFFNIDYNSLNNQMAKKFKHLPAVYQSYVNLIPEDEVLQAQINNQEKMNVFLGQLPEDNGNYRYAENKWTVKQVISHIIDTERVFSYRALRFARNDKTPLPGFNENDYIPNSNASNRKIKDLSVEFNNLRKSTIDLFMSFDPEMMERFGESGGKTVDVNAIGFIIAGHCLHHYNILKERYNL